MRIVIIALIIILILGSIGLAFRFNQKASYANKELEQERYLRLTTEQMLEETSQQREALKTDLNKAQETIKGLSRVTEQTQAFNNDLKDRLEKASRIKESLEMKLKELESVLPGQQQTPANSVNP